MAKGILGLKVGMTQVYDAETGIATPVTVIQAGPCHVLQLRTPERDGYEAVQIGFLDKKRPQDRRSRKSQASRSERGHVASKMNSKRSARLASAGVAIPDKADCEPKRFIRELRGPAGDAAVGQEIRVSVFGETKAVDVTGTSRGRGFAGVMKRHNFAGQRASHGVKKVHRHTGGTSMATFPGRTFKGQNMAGHYGNAKVTVRNLKVVRVDEKNNLLLVAGAVPGPNGGLLVIKESNKVG